MPKLLDLDLLPHPTAAPPGKFPDDDRLRAFEYRIHDRPKRGVAVWESRREGMILPQPAALAWIDWLIAECEC